MELIDLSGQRFGRLVVLYKAKSAIAPNGTIRTMWHCRCDCGKEVDKSSANLRHSAFPSCGCYRRERTSQVRLDDLTGQRFGRLTVLGRSQDRPSGLTVWHCRCDCGNEIDAIGNNLKRGHTKSCGCFRIEHTAKAKTTHGMRQSRIYAVWSKIKERCYNPQNPSYKRYGGRGISMCDEWKDNAQSFIQWAYENGYNENAEFGQCTLDRIDNSKGYSPENCRWVTEKVQANNRRSNKLITHNGETKTLAEWRDQFGWTQSKAYYHLVEKGRSIQELIDLGIVSDF